VKRTGPEGNRNLERGRFLRFGEAIEPERLEACFCARVRESTRS
jgi:hypothetical protein